MLAIFLNPLILRALRARKIKGFRKMAKVLFEWDGLQIVETADQTRMIDCFVTL
jgi:hypothetical protein